MIVPSFYSRLPYSEETEWKYISLLRLTESCKERMSETIPVSHLLHSILDQSTLQLLLEAIITAGSDITDGLMAHQSQPVFLNPEVLRIICKN